MALWFPFLPTDRIRRVAAPDLAADMPLVITERIANALRLMAVDQTAMKSGLYPGMALTDARARLETIHVVPAQVQQDNILLKRMAYWCERYTPLVALDNPHGLLLDITGCAHLFGGLQAMRNDVVNRLRQTRLSVRAAITDNAFTARLLARHSKGGVFDRQAADELLPALPLTALDLDDSVETGLKRAGLKSIGDVMAIPRAALTARFGKALVICLDRIAQREIAPISPLHMRPLVMAERRLADPVTGLAHIEHILHELAGELFLRLAEEGQGAVLIEASFLRVDGDVRSIRIETGQPLHDANIFLRLARERLNALTDPLDAGFGFDWIRLSALRVARLVARQSGLDQRENSDAEFSQLIDRLSARLGGQRILVARMNDTHMPERAYSLRPALHAQKGPSEDVSPPVCTLPGDPPARPIKLFQPPQLVMATSELPDNPPVLFQWRRVAHRIRLAEGPERIEPEWWLSIGMQPPLCRDYYRVEDENGQRFWLFREGLYDGESPPRWFLHGLFA